MMIGEKEVKVLQGSSNLNIGNQTNKCTRVYGLLLQNEIYRVYQQRFREL